MNKYNQLKEAARQQAIEWQYENANKNTSYVDLYESQQKFEKLAKRYGLVREFRENGII